MMSPTTIPDSFLVADWLFDAAADVEEAYFRLPVAGQAKPTYRERVYCYELYHQWRARWKPECTFSLCGEIDKAGHPLIRGRRKPDFLVHVPGAMTNLLAVEVKAGCSRPTALVKDLRTLTYFRRDLGQQENYTEAFLFMFGVTAEQWVPKARRLVALAAGDESVDLTLIQPVLHSAFGARAFVTSWNTMDQG